MIPELIFPSHLLVLPPLRFPFPSTSPFNQTSSSSSHSDPYKVMRSGPSESNKGDPLSEVQSELDGHRYISLPGLPKFTGGAMGYLSMNQSGISNLEPQ